MSNSAAETILNAVVNRRTIYSLTPELPAGVTIFDVKHAVQTIVKEIPTAFNGQSNRAVILTGAPHKKLWDTVANSIGSDAGKKRPISARDEAYGTVLFFTNDKTTADLQAQFASFADAFPVFATHSSGGAQMMAWTTLEAMGLGGHLQHYNGLVKNGLPEEVNAEGWTAHSQLVFGKPAVPAGEKTYIENDVTIYN
ncbi:putative nitroreductase [Monosporozyma unispora]|nr:putative nitroreductase [Kazachstania unispora]